MLTFEQQLVPVWDTDTVYGESLTMVRDAAGVAAAPLLYAPKQILEVTSATGEEFYEEGRDWVWRDGLFTLTAESRIFAFTQEELYPAEGETGVTSFPMPGGNIRFAEGDFFHRRQIAVTYTTDRCDWPGVKPVSAAAQLPRTFAALREARPLHVLLFGDSISLGGNASKMSSIPPYQASYGELLCEALARKYGAPVRFTNNAIGGQETTWGIKWVDRMVCDYRPDLVVLAFGMNDGNKTPEEFAGHTRTIIEHIRSACPDTELLLVATSTPNPILTDPAAPFWGTQSLFKPALDALAADPALGGGMAVADITGMQQALHSRKRFIDTTGNHVNHPNDFFHRCYAQYLLGMLSE